MKTHNTHILIPEDLWQRIVDRAGHEGTTATEILCRAARRYLKNKPAQRRAQ